MKDFLWFVVLSILGIEVVVYFALLLKRVIFGKEYRLQTIEHGKLYAFILLTMIEIILVIVIIKY